MKYLMLVWPLVASGGLTPRTSYRIAIRRVWVDLGETVNIELAFPLGQLVITPSALAILTDQDIIASLHRYCSKDWGDVCKEDWKQNDLALEQGNRLLAAYRSADGTPYWIITEWDRSCTTILLPEDY